MVKKAAVGRSKSPPLAVKKTVACSGSPKRARKKRCYISTRNKVITFSTGASRTFFTANGGLFVFAAFPPATRQARMGGAVNIRELALEISPDTHRRIGRRPEKPQIFLSFIVMAYSRNMETHK